MSADDAKRAVRARVREYRRFTRPTDNLPRVIIDGETIELDSAPSAERYRRPVDSAPRNLAGWR